MFAFSSYAQQGFEVGVRGMFQNNWLINDKDFAEGPTLDFEATWGQAYGISLGYNFTDHLGVRTNILYASTGQKYKGDFSEGSNEDGAYSNVTLGQHFLTSPSSVPGEYNAEVSLKYLKFPLMFRANSFPYKGAFFSFLIGPQLNMLSGATHYYNSETIDYTDVPGISDFETKDVYTNSHLSVVMGLGADVSLTDLLKLNINFRFDYSFQDVEDKGAEIVSGQEFWSDERPETTMGSGGLMLGLTYTIQ
jgi:hypothetical protein